MTFSRIGRFGFQHRWPVIILWIVLFITAVPILPRVPDVLTVGGFSSPEMESARTRELLDNGIPGFSQSDLIVIFQHEQWTATSPEFVAQAETTLAGVEGLPEIEQVIPFTASPRQISDDGHTAYTVLQLDLPSEQSQRFTHDIRRLLRPTDLRVRLAGGPAFYADIERVSERDLRRAEVIAIPFALIALVLVFGSVVAAAVPVIVGGISVSAVLGTIFLVAHAVDLSIFVLNLATMLGLGLAIDYSLFMVSRFREELSHTDVEHAVVSTVSSAGRAVFFSGLTVLIGLSGLVLFDFMFLRSVGIAGMLVVLFALCGALTLLPAVLAVVGQRINALTFIRRAEVGRFWHSVSNAVMEHPWRVLIPVVLFIGLLGVPFTRVNLSSPDATILPQSTPSRQGFEILRSEFGDGEISPIIIAVQSDQPIAQPDNIAALYHLTRKIAADPRVWRIDSIVTLDPRIGLDQYQALYSDPAAIGDPFVQSAWSQLAGSHVAAIYVYSRSLPASDEAKGLLASIRSLDPGPGLRMLVDGGTAEIVDVVDTMYGKFPIAIALVVAATYLTLLIQFRSVLLPLKAVLMNTMSIVGSYGALVFIFQEGHFSQFLGFTPMGFVEASLPVLMFCLLFGVSMDYEVFLLSRVREVWDETRDNRLAVSTGLARSGRIITGAALILFVVAASFVTAEIVLIKALGLGIAIAVALDATIIRALLVPSTMRLLGHLNWWAPQFVRRLIPASEMKH